VERNAEEASSVVNRAVGLSPYDIVLFVCLFIDSCLCVYILVVYAGFLARVANNQKRNIGLICHVL